MPVQVLPKVETDVISQTYGRFVIGPLERGFGTTVGNALRRVLLSSLPGAAVTKVRIFDVPHEFTVIPGVREDAMRFILHVKQLRLKMEEGDEARHMSLHVEDEGIVTAGDIVAPPEIEILNPDLYLLTVDDENSSIDVDFTVERGRGYRAAEEGSGEVVGELPVDALFSPIRRVALDVERARVGQITDYDRLTLEIWSDGRIEPRDALEQAARILVKHLRLIAGLSLEEEEVGLVEEEEEEAGLPGRIYRIPIDQLGLSTRVYNALRRAGIENVGEVLEILEEGGDDALLAVRNIGTKSLDEVKTSLQEADLLEEIGEGGGG